MFLFAIGIIRKINAPNKEIEKQNKEIEKQNKEIEKQNKEIEKHNNTIKSQLNALEEQNKIISEQNKIIIKKAGKIFKQGTSIDNLHNKLKTSNEKYDEDIKSLYKKINNNENKLNDLWISLSLEKNLNNQIRIFSRKNVTIVENQYKNLLIHIKCYI